MNQYQTLLDESKAMSRLIWQQNYSQIKDMLARLNGAIEELAAERDALMDNAQKTWLCVRCHVGYNNLPAQCTCGGMLFERADGGGFAGAPLP